MSFPLLTPALLDSHPVSRGPARCRPVRSVAVSLPRPLAFVLGAGGSHGAVQVGQLRALRDHGIRPDLLVGASVGALNAVVAAADPDRAPETLEGVWRGLTARSLAARRSAGHRSLLGDGGLRRLLSPYTPHSFADLSIPLHVVAARRGSGDPHLLADGAVLPALLASCAIPYLLPAVTIDGVALVDGGMRHDLPIATAFASGAASVVALPTTRWPRPVGYRSSSPVTDPRVVVMGGAVAPGTGWSFARTAQLIERGERGSRRVLREADLRVA